MPKRAAPHTHRFVPALAALACGLALAPGAAAAPPPMSASGIPAFSDAMLPPGYWIRRAAKPAAVLLDARATAAQRAAAYVPGGGFIDVRHLPATLTRDAVADWIRQAAQSPVKPAVDDAGHPVGADTLQSLRDDTAVDHIPATAVPYAVFKDPVSGQMRRTKLNQVSVTPLLPLHADDTTLYVDAMTSLVQPTRR